MTDKEPELVTLPDGRVLDVQRYGTPGGPAVIFHHGTPGALSSARLLASLARECGLELMAYSRAGYGRSTPRPGRRVSSVVEDIAALREHLGIGDYLSVGWSGGGPHALACAALDPACRGAISLAGVAPFDADIDWSAGMGPENIAEFDAARRGGADFEASLEEMAMAMREVRGPEVAASLGGLVDEPDIRALEDEDTAEILATSFRDAFAMSGRGMIDDDYAFVGEWGFSPSSIDRPVQVWFGDADRMVPSSHGLWLGEQIPDAVIRRFPAEGHVSLITRRHDELGEALRSFLST